MSDPQPAPMAGRIEEVWRRESAQVLGALLRRHGDLADCEDAAQEALAAAALQWPREGVPDRPAGWLIRVASRRLVDQVRSDRSRTAREQADHAADPGAGIVPDEDDSLRLLVLCCHPALSRPSQVALTLRAVAGLSTAEIAAAFLVPERTMGQRLSRARSTLRAAGAPFTLPTDTELPARIAAVLDVLYLTFNEGYATSGGGALVNASLTAEAVRLTRQLRARLPDHDEVAGALALMLLTRAREDARRDDRGDLIPLAEQDRARWDPAAIAEGLALVTEILPRGPVGAFQLQAAIAAVHAEAATYAETDWDQIAVLYAMLDRVAPSPVVTLNRAVAIGMSESPEAGLALVEPLLADPAMRRHHRTYAVRAHLLERCGRTAEARVAYAEAARRTASTPEQRYLLARAARLD